MPGIRRLFALAAVGASWLTVVASPASASVTLGQVNPSFSGATVGGEDLAQSTVSSGAGYEVPENGTIISWSHNAAPVTNQKLAMKIFRKVREPNFYEAVSHDGPQPLTGGLLNNFAVSLPVKRGDIIGLNATTGSVICIWGSFPTDTFLTRVGSLNDGEQASFTPGSGGRLNLSAVLAPTNTVTLGGTTLNKKKGTATLNLTLPNDGELSATGSGVSASSAGHAQISKAVSAGAAQLLIKATGKKRKTLNQTGKVKLSVTITYTPQNGDPGTQTVKVKLKKL